MGRGVDPQVGGQEDHSFVNVKQALLRVTGLVINPLRCNSPTLKMDSPLHLKDKTGSVKGLKPNSLGMESIVSVPLVCPSASPQEVT